MDIITDRERSAAVRNRAPVQIVLAVPSRPNNRKDWSVQNDTCHGAGTVHGYIVRRTGVGVGNDKEMSLEA